MTGAHIWSFVILATLSAVCFQQTVAAKPGSQPQVVLPQYTGTPGKANQYSHFAKLLAGVLLLREGGVDEAIQALPRVRNHTLGHVAVYSLSKKLKDNGKQALANKHLNEKLAKLGLKFGKIPKKVADKINKKKPPNPIEKKVIDKINEKVGEVIDADSLAGLNKKLGESKLNTQITPVAINPEAVFGNSASIISQTIIGMQAAAIGVNFNPCLVSVAPVGFQSLAVGLNFVPHLIDIQPGGIQAVAVGANIQPTLALIAPSGIQATPSGARIIPWLLGVAPTGAWINPEGAFIAPLGLLAQPAGTFVAPVAKPVVSARVAITGKPAPAATPAATPVAADTNATASG